MRTLTRQARDEYLELVAKFPLTSIKDEAKLREAQKVMDEILKTPRLKQGALAYVDALSDLVMAHESRHHPMPMPSDADLLRQLMESRETTQVELHKATGLALSTISEVLSGKRPFSKTMIAKLSAYFDISKGYFAANF